MLTVQNFLLMSIICQKKYGIIFWEQILWIIFSFFSFVDLRWAQLYVSLVLHQQLLLLPFWGLKKDFKKANKEKYFSLLKVKVFWQVVPQAGLSFFHARALRLVGGCRFAPKLQNVVFMAILCCLDCLNIYGRNDQKLRPTFCNFILHLIHLTWKLRLSTCRL